jgi:hypothetical protein
MPSTWEKAAAFLIWMIFILVLLKLVVVSVLAFHRGFRDRIKELKNRPTNDREESA